MDFDALQRSVSGAVIPRADARHAAARESGAQVRGFRPAERSLEDIFLEAVDSA